MKALFPVVLLLYLLTVGGAPQALAADVLTSGPDVAVQSAAKETAATQVPASAEGEVLPAAAPATMAGGEAAPSTPVADSGAKAVTEATAAGPAAGPADAGLDADYKDDGKDGSVDAAKKEPPPQISDPLEPFNRAMYHFNDKLYFWVVKPVARGYRAVIPAEARTGVNNFFSNLAFPIRFVNSILQADVKGAGIELGRFCLNTMAGVGGFIDIASDEEIGLVKQEKDTGQTFGFYGIGTGIYLVWPWAGPSNVRDTVGLVGDVFLHPLAYLDPWYAAFGIRAYDRLNETSLTLGDYETLKEASVDHYVAIRDAYIQYRAGKVKKARER